MMLSVYLRCLDVLATHLTRQFSTFPLERVHCYTKVLRQGSCVNVTARIFGYRDLGITGERWGLTQQGHLV